MVARPFVPPTLNTGTDALALESLYQLHQGGQILRRTYENSYWLVALLMCFTLLISACQAGNRIEVLTEEAPESPVTSAPEGSPPALVYIDDGSLVEQMGNGPQRRTELPDTDTGAVLAATLVDETVLVLREQALQRATFHGSSDIMLRFDKPARFGQLISTVDGKYVFYDVTVDDAQGRFGFGTRIGRYQAKSGIVKPVLFVHQNVRALGLTTDGNGLYLLPIGQDPSFGRILIAELESGTTIDEMPIEGEVFSALSPNGQYLVTASPRYASEDVPLGGILRLYDLASQPFNPREIALPNQPSHAWGLLWSPDSRWVYFVLRAGDIYDEPAMSYGLWRLDIVSGEMQRVTAIEETSIRPAAISPDGQWLLVRNEMREEAFAVHVQSGTRQSFILPTEAVVVGWK